MGTWLPGGRLKIIDRKKSLFKLAQGEYIAPEKLEDVFSRSPLVAQAFVYGNSLRAQLVAVLVPDPDTLFPWAASRWTLSPMHAPCVQIHKPETPNAFTACTPANAPDVRHAPDVTAPPAPPPDLLFCHGICVRGMTYHVMRIGVFLN